MSWQARLEIYKKGFLDEVDAILGDQEDKEHRYKLALEIDSMAMDLAQDVRERVEALEGDDEPVSKPD